jgi:hypothetical protein
VLPTEEALPGPLNYNSIFGSWFWSRTFIQDVLKAAYRDNTDVPGKHLFIYKCKWITVTNDTTADRNKSSMLPSFWGEKNLTPVKIITVKRLLGHPVLRQSLRYFGIRKLVFQPKPICLTLCVTLIYVGVQYECEFQREEWERKWQDILRHHNIHLLLIRKAIMGPVD